MKTLLTIVVIPILLMFSFFGIGTAQSLPDTLFFQTEIDSLYESYLDSIDQLLAAHIDTNSIDSLKMKALMGQILVRISLVHVDIEDAFTELDSILTDVEDQLSSLNDILENDIKTLNTNDLNQFIQDLRDRFIGQRYTDIKTTLEDAFESIDSDVFETEDIFNNLFDSLDFHFEVMGNNLDTLSASDVDFNLPIQLIDDLSTIKRFVVSRDNFDDFDSLKISIENADDAFNRAGSILDSLRDFSEADTGLAIGELQLTFFYFRDAINQLPTLLTQQPFEPLEIDTAFVDDLNGVIDDIDSLLSGTEYDLGSEGKTIRPVALIENFPADLVSIFLDFYRMPLNDRFTYTFGNLFPLGLPGEIINRLAENAIFHETDNFSERLDELQTDYETILAGDPDNPEANLGMALIKAFDLFGRSMEDLSDVIEFLSKGDISGLTDEFSFESFGYSSTTDSIKNHFDIARDDKDIIFTILIKNNYDSPDSLHIISEGDDYMPLYLTAIQLEILLGLEQGFELAKNGIVDNLENLWNEIETMFIMDLDPNLLDFTEIDSSLEIIDILENSNPDFLEITDYGIDKMVEAGENIKNNLGDLSKTSGHLLDLFETVSVYDEDLGFDGDMFVDIFSIVDSIINELKLDFEVSESAIEIDEEKVNLSAWFDNPPRQLLQRFRWFLDDDDDTDNTLAGLFPDRGIGILFAPVLVSPADGAVFTIFEEITLTWQPALNADNYAVQIATENIFTNIVFEESQIAETSISIGTLTEGSYFWRNRTNNQNNTSDWSVVFGFSTFGPLGINRVNEIIPKEFSLYQNYPNPFNPQTNINFALPVSGFVTLKIYNLLGREMASLVSMNLSAGLYSKTWNAVSLPSGIYFYRIRTEKFIQTRRLVLLK